MLASAALTIGHTSKRASGAGSGFTAPSAPRAPNRTSTPIAKTSLATLGRRRSSTCHGVIRTLFGRYSRCQPGLGLHADETILLT
jgi:hypothetical protein